MTCISRRRARISCSLNLYISLPSNHTFPEVGSSSRSRRRPAVDLPQPDSPTSASVSPACSSKLMPSTAWTFLKCLTSRSARRRGSIMEKSKPPAREKPARFPPSQGGPPAGGKVMFFDRKQGGNLAAAFVDRERTSRVESAAVRKSGGVGDEALDRGEALLLEVQARNGAEQAY